MADTIGEYLTGYKPMRTTRKGMRSGRAANPYCAIADNHYTTGELQIIREHYPIGGADAVQEQLKIIGSNRSIHSIQKRAEKMQVRYGNRTGSAKWSDQETSIFAKNITLPTDDIVRLLKQYGFDRSHSSVRSRKPIIKKIIEKCQQ